MCIHILRILCMYFPARTRQICRNEKKCDAVEPIIRPVFLDPRNLVTLYMCVPPVTNNVLRVATEQALGLTRV